MARSWWSSAAILMLAACGSPSTVTTQIDKGETTIVTAGGAGGTVVTKVGSSLTPVPSDLPRWAPAYPGATVAQVSKTSMPGGSQTIVVLLTADSKPKVMAFYDQKIAALQIKPMLSADEADGSCSGTPKGLGEDGSMRAIDTPGGQEALAVGNDEGQTAISISYRTRQ